MRHNCNAIFYVGANFYHQVKGHHANLHSLRARMACGLEYDGDHLQSYSRQLIVGYVQIPSP